MQRYNFVIRLCLFIWHCWFVNLIPTHNQLFRCKTYLIVSYFKYWEKKKHDWNSLLPRLKHRLRQEKIILVLGTQYQTLTWKSKARAKNLLLRQKVILHYKKRVGYRLKLKFYDTQQFVEMYPGFILVDINPFQQLKFISVLHTHVARPSLHRSPSWTNVHD